MADTLRTPDSDIAILDAMISCCTHALGAGVPDDQVRSLDTFRLALLGARNISAKHWVRSDASEEETKALVEVVLRGIGDHAYRLATQIEHRGYVEPEHPLGIARSAYYTLTSTARAYLVTTEGCH